ncbi:FrnE protein [Photobacterium aphoticum]|uniref:FrnE protein n=1 Tax=Photobacterium aphoticum TaxID=754436 RepID=A0A090QKK1_9GAMM|nr:FrnE protein [Photobacterium aphoticum]
MKQAMNQKTKQAMKPALRIDFFHDVICGWCYVLSPRLRQLATEFDLDIHHHAFALTATRADQIDKFGSVEQAKNIIMGHWEQCAKADDAQRINVAGMRAQSFDYPISTPGWWPVKRPRNSREKRARKPRIGIILMPLPMRICMRTAILPMKTFWSQWRKRLA